MTRSLALALSLLLAASLAVAHDFWLVPVGSEIEARTGSRFPVSTNAVAPEQLAEAVAVSTAGRTPLEVVGRRDSALVLKADPTVGGTSGSRLRSTLAASTSPPRTSTPTCSRTVFPKSTRCASGAASWTGRRSSDIRSSPRR